MAELLPAEHPDLRQPMSAWHEKYRTLFAGDGFERFAAAIPQLGSSAWSPPSSMPGTTAESIPTSCDGSPPLLGFEQMLKANAQRHRR